jgi:signal transduction histidine kinase
MIDGVYPLDVPTIESVHEETIRLARLIDTLRELEIIESGRLELALEEVDAVEIARKAVNLFTSSTKEKGIRLFIETMEGTAFRVRADYLRLGEVVYNLLSNAIKYAPSGGSVRVAVSRDARSNLVEVAVDDSGPGIPPQERERVFERFYRIDKSRARGGTGLGLAIAAEIVKAHGGSITIGDSDLGGASFVVAIPSSILPRMVVRSPSDAI